MAIAARPGRGGVTPQPTTWRERLGALRNLPPFLAMVWRTSRLLTMITLAVRLVRALLPIATLFVGKLIIDEVVHLTHLTVRPPDLAGWLGSGLLGDLQVLLLAEFALSRNCRLDQRMLV
jgi:ATP-binding cassette subfamily B protein